MGGPTVLVSQYAVLMLNLTEYRCEEDMVATNGSAVTGIPTITTTEDTRDLNWRLTQVQANFIIPDLSTKREHFC